MKLSYLFIGGSAHGKNISVESEWSFNSFKPMWKPMYYVEIPIPEETPRSFNLNCEMSTAISNIDIYESLRIVDPLQPFQPFYVFFHSSYATPEEKIKAYEEYIK